MPISSTSPRDLRVDAYLAAAAPYARPILVRLRDAVHATCPEVVETTKWSRPFFEYRGSPLCFIAAFKSHCSFGFWRGKELGEPPSQEGGAGMGHLGRLTSVDDLPPSRELGRRIEAAMRLVEAGAKPVRARGPSAGDVVVPDDLVAALDAVPSANRHFAAFSQSARREYVAWIVDAKRPETRAARIATTVAWCADGKTRHWKYQSSAGRSPRTAHQE